jgi:hypothetical protein
MKIKSIHMLLTLGLILLFDLYYSGAGLSEAKVRDCPSQEKIVAELADTEEILQQTKLQLHDLLSGSKIINTRPEALLVVNLDDKGAIERRYEELREATNRSLIQNISESLPIFKCAFEDKTLRPKVEKLFALKQEIDLLRLKFLQLPKNKRNELLKIQNSEVKWKVHEQVLKERSAAIEDRAETRAQLNAAEYRALTAESPDLKLLASERVVLEKTKNDILTIKIQFLSQVEERSRLFLDSAKRLLDIKGQWHKDLEANEIIRRIGEIKEKSLKATELEELKKDYKDSVQIWRSLVDKAYKGAFRGIYSVTTPKLPAYPENIINKIGNTPETQHYRDSYNDAQEITYSLQRLTTEISEKERDATYLFLLAAADVRADLLNELLCQDERSPVTINKAYIEDIKRELKIIPYRWMGIITAKTYDIRAYLNMGFEGMIKLIQEVMLFLIFLAFFVFFWLSLKRLTSVLNRLRLWLIRKRSKYPLARRLALFINTFIPYSVWLVILPATGAANYLINKSIFSELAIFLPYINIYSLYRIVSLFIKDSLITFTEESFITVDEKIQKRIGNNSRSFSLIFFFSLLFLHALESMVSQGLVYQVVVKGVIVISFLFLVWLAHQWKNELASFIDNYFISYAFGRWISKICRGRLSLIICLPVMVFTFLFLSISRLGSFFEHSYTYKRVTAAIFKHKLEMTSSDQTVLQKDELPSEYSKWFTSGEDVSMSLMVIPQKDLLEKLEDSIDRWHRGITEVQSLAIYGDQGSGKSWLLARLEREFQDLRVLKTSISEKMFTRNQVLSLFEKLLEVPLAGGVDSLIYGDAKMTRTLILIDNAQNLFLSKLGGFDGFRTLLELVSASTKNIFWCALFNAFSWTYLDSVFRRNRGFDMVEKIPRWSDGDIKELILRRHSKTSYRLSYDSVINAAGSEQGTSGRIEHIESNFFTLLWQQSNGNPKAALYYWLSSLKKSDSSLLRVGLPEEAEKGRFLNLLEDELFVYTELVRHGQLSMNEVIAVTDLPEGIVREALREGAKRRMLICSDDGYYQVNVFYQDTLINILKQKNFIYGR